jgi:hypothetical protein
MAPESESNDADGQNPMVYMMRWHLRWPVVCALFAIAALSACSDGSGPSELTLDDLTDPDTNTAVVVLDRDLIEGADTVTAVVEEVYLVATALAPEIISANLGLKQVKFTVSDIYSTERYLTDFATNTFIWVGPTGREYYPVTRCAVTVRSAYIAQTPSTMWLETACDVAPLEGGTSFKVLVKVRRFGTPEEGP